MEVKIIWTKRALLGLANVVEYLEYKWTAREIENLETKIDDFLERIKQQPHLYPKTDEQGDTRKGLVDKNNYIIYKYNRTKSEIAIINLRSTKQKPLNEG